MAQPKKLSHREKLMKKEEQQLKEHQQKLIRLRTAMRNNPRLDAYDTWRWAALQVFNDLQKVSLRFHTAKLAAIKEQALEIAVEAQAIINFTN
jgi:hypothetical protein